MSVRMRMCVTIDAPPAEVWADIERIDTHAEWMRDAESIRVVGSQRTGLGTEVECRTRIGPFATTDVIVVTEWKPRRALGIAHRGAFAGRGRFTLRRRRGQRTRFCWAERISFPWWMGGVVGERVAKPVLKHVWKGNLRRLAARFR